MESASRRFVATSRTRCPSAKRAKGTLEKGLDDSLQEQRSARKHEKRSVATDKMSYRDYVELSSIEEYRKFKTLPPIVADDLGSLDMDDLLRKLSGE